MKWWYVVYIIYGIGVNLSFVKIIPETLNTKH